MNTTKRMLCLLLIAALLLPLSACNKADGNLTKDVLADAGIKEVSASGKFTAGYTKTALSLMKQTMRSSENSLVSPLSVMLALGMCANGASGATQSEMLDVLCGLSDLETLNEQLYSMCCRLVTSEYTSLDIANSIWLRQGEQLKVNDDFIKAAASWYNAAAFAKPFDSGTLRDINSWVSDNTNGTIDKIIDEISPNSMVYLINTILLDAKWVNPYKEFQVTTKAFTSADNTKSDVSFLNSDEYSYISDSRAQGFTKAYNDGYRFVGILPNEGVSCEEYISSLSEADYAALISSETDAHVAVSLPKFEYDCEYTLNDVLAAMGMPQAFDPSSADFTNLATMSDGTRLFISKVLHKTHVELNEAGTTASAVTAVEMECGCALEEPGSIIQLNFNRPFIYMIIEDETNLPLFCGYVASVK